MAAHDVQSFLARGLCHQGRFWEPLLIPGGAAQDAKTWWQRNKVEEGGGGYLGYGWDSAIWGVNVQLAALTNNSAPQWAAEARTQAPQPADTSGCVSMTWSAVCRVCIKP